MVDEKEVLKELLVDEEDVIQDLSNLVKKAKDVFVIEKSTGNVIFIDFGRLSNTQRVCALLIGKYFAMKLEIIKDASLAISEIGKELAIPMTTLSAPLGVLVSKGFVTKLPKRKYIIAYHRIKDIFSIYFGGKQNG